MENLSEAITAALANKNPSVKTQTCQFLYRAFKNFGSMTDPSKSVKTFVPNLIKVAFCSSL